MKIRIQHISLMFFLALMISKSFAQENTLKEEKYSIGAGIGWDFGGTGITGKYFFKDNIAVTASMILPNLGLEVNIPISIADKVVPFVSVRYGVNNQVRLSNNELDPFGGPTITKQKWFAGFIYGVGVKYKYRKDKRRYLSLSANYIHRLSIVSEFVDDFNQEHGTDHNIEPKDFIRPSLGMVFYFN